MVFCPSLYIGQTGRCLAFRFAQHRTSDSARTCRSRAISALRIIPYISCQYPDFLFTWGQKDSYLHHKQRLNSLGSFTPHRLNSLAFFIWHLLLLFTPTNLLSSMIQLHPYPTYPYTLHPHPSSDCFPALTLHTINHTSKHNLQ